MIHSLRIRFLLIFITVVALAVAMVALFARRGTANQFDRFVQQRTIQDEIAIQQLLEPPVLAGDFTTAQAMAEQIGDVYGRPVTLANEQGQIIIASAPELVGTVIEFYPGPPPEQAPPPPSHNNTIAIERGRSVTFFVDPQTGIEFAPDAPVRSDNPPPITQNFLEGIRSGEIVLDQNEADFLGSVDRSFIWAAALAVGVTALLSFGLSRRIFGPIEALTLAARQMEKGNLSQRVVVNGEDEVSALGHAFNSMADSLAKQEQLRRNMVSDVAHELRTPLSNIRGYLEALQDGVLSADLTTINSLHEEAMLLNHLIEDLQEVSLAEAGQLRLNSQPVHLPDLIEQAVNSVQFRAAEQAVTIRIDLPDELPLVTADPERISQILRNLLQNGITYAAGGEIMITARQTAFAAPTTSDVTLSIRDNGAGIDPEHLPHIFDRFYRADESRHRSTGGTGLGLAIVKALVEMQNGRIWVESTRGQGTAFFFTLPKDSNR